MTTTVQSRFMSSKIDFVRLCGFLEFFLWIRIGTIWYNTVVERTVRSENWAFCMMVTSPMSKSVRQQNCTTVNCKSWKFNTQITFSVECCIKAGPPEICTLSCKKYKNIKMLLNCCRSIAT